ncbi:hypothetical protein [Sinomonas humi]|uniref:hypothetical protein n=1 Tax=Sinomonas humi TaxID=1338436 RepID=UPI0012E08DC7|nr:hypothetical protein [Sinomonas humi]
MAPSRFLPLRRSARVTLWCAAAATVITGITAWFLEEWMGILTLAAIAAFVLSALYAVRGMNRYVLAALAAATTATTVGCTLAFLRVLGVAWDDAPDAVTTISSRDADPYFYIAVAAFIATLVLLLAGAAWPQRRPAPARASRRPSSRAGSRPGPTSSRGTGPRAATGRAQGSRSSEGRPSAARTNPPKQAAPRPSASGARASGSRPSAPRNR